MMSKVSTAIVALVLIAALASSLCAQPIQEVPGLTLQDRHFVLEAAENILVGLDLGRLAIEKASTPEVKQYGQMVLDDLKGLYGELEELSIGKSVALPKKPGNWSRAQINRLSKLTGSEFDADCMTAMVRLARTDVSDYREETGEGGDTRLVLWAAKNLSIMKRHLQRGREIAEAAKRQK